MTRVVGIDLGTSKSVVCVLENGRPRILANAQGAQYTPSVVGFNDDGSVIIGQKAADRAIRHPERTATAVRRRLGTDWRFTNHGTTYTAPQITACVLRKLKRDAQAALGAEFSDVVLSVPAYYGEAERRATLEAAELAGLRVRRLVGETNLAGFAYTLQARPADETTLVLDFGAGTFSVSLLQIGEGVTEVRAVAGDNALGGDNFDERLADTLVHRLRANTGIDLSGDTAALQRIRAAAELAKIELSGATTTVLNLPYIATDGGGNPVFLTENITRADFTALTADLLDRCRAPITEVIADAGISMREVDRVILIGGASRMPAFAALVTEVTGHEPYRGMHPEESVAIGAAAQTGVFDGTIRDQLLLDATPISIGIATRGGKFTKLIERNTTIGTVRESFVTTTADNQSTIDIEVFQGEHEEAARNRPLGTLRLGPLAPAPRGTYRIKLVIDIDANGRTVVTATDPASGDEKTLTAIGDSQPPSPREPVDPAAAVEMHPDQDTGTHRERKHTAAQTPPSQGGTSQSTASSQASATPKYGTTPSAAAQGGSARACATQSSAAHSDTAGFSSSGARAASAPDQPSPLIIEAAAKHQLGQHISTHPHRWYGGKGAWIIGIPIVLLGGLIIAAGITDGASGAIGTAVFFAIVAVLVWVRKAISSPRHTLARANYVGSRTTGTGFGDAQLSLFEHGVVVLSGGQTSAFRWETVSVLQDIVRTSHRTYGTETGVSMTYRYQLTDPGGDRYLVTHGFNGPEQWGPAIQNRVTAAQLPAAIAAIDRGESLEFGSLALNLNQVIAHGQAVPWTRVEEIRVQKGFISIRVAGQWLSLTKVTVSAIPNVFVFLDLAERLRTAAAART